MFPQEFITGPHIISLTLTNGSFGTLCGGRTSKSGLRPPDACIEGLGAALVHHCDGTKQYISFPLKSWFYMSLLTL